MGDQLNGNANPTARRLLKGSGNIYRVEITNAKYTNRVITDIAAAAGTGNPPIFGVTDIEDDTQVVRATASSRPQVDTDDRFHSIFALLDTVGV